MNRLLLIVVFLSLFTFAGSPIGPKSIEAKGQPTTTVQVFTRSYPEYKLKVEVIPINKERISKYFFRDNISDLEIIAFYVVIENEGDSLYHLLRKRFVYRNVLREDLDSMDKLAVVADPDPLQMDGDPPASIDRRGTQAT